MPCCVAWKCSTRSGTGKLMHRFPREQKRRQIWANKVKRENWFPHDNSFLCSDHFDDGQYESNRADNLRKLKPFAVPTLFAYQKVSPKFRKPPKKRSSNADNSESNIPSKKLLLEHGYSTKKLDRGNSRKKLDSTLFQEKDCPSDDESDKGVEDDLDFPDFPDFPKDHDLPKDSTDQNLPKDSTDQNLPKDSTDQNLPKDSTDQDLPNDSSDEDFPCDSLSEDLANDSPDERGSLTETTASIPNMSLERKVKRQEASIARLKKFLRKERRMKNNLLLEKLSLEVNLSKVSSDSPSQLLQLDNPTMAFSAARGLKEKVVIITGASSGIGRGCAISFAKEGCFVALNGRNTEALEEVKKLCHEAGAPEDKVLCIAGDVSKEEDCERVVSSTVSHFGYLDVLVNSAGILVAGGIETLSVEDYDKQMNINTRSVFVMMKLALPHILKRKGSIVNVSSVTGLRAFPGVVSYNMSKAAVDQLTRSVALEVAERGVRVNAVNPGVIVTEVHKRSGMSNDAYDKFLEHSKTTHAMGRVGEVQEVVDAVIYLASDNSSFITGVTLPIDGGRSIMCPR